MTLEADLKKNAKFSNESEVAAFNETLKKMALSKDANYIEIMLSYLDDDCEYGDVMKNIIGMAETFEVCSYINAVVHVIDDLKEKAPDWLEVIHYRITNSKPHTEAYKEKLRLLNYPEYLVNYLKDFLDANPEKFSEVEYILSENP